MAETPDSRCGNGIAVYGGGGVASSDSASNVTLDRDAIEMLNRYMARYDEAFRRKNSNRPGVKMAVSPRERVPARVPSTAESSHSVDVHLASPMNRGLLKKSEGGGTLDRTSRSAKGAQDGIVVESSSLTFPSSDVSVAVPLALPVADGNGVIAPAISFATDDRCGRVGAKSHSASMAAKEALHGNDQTGNDHRITVFADDPGSMRKKTSGILPCDSLKKGSRQLDKEEMSQETSSLSPGRAPNRDGTTDVRPGFQKISDLAVKTPHLRGVSSDGDDTMTEVSSGVAHSAMSDPSSPGFAVDDREPMPRDSLRGVDSHQSIPANHILPAPRSSIDYEIIDVTSEPSRPVPRSSRRVPMLSNNNKSHGNTALISTPSLPPAEHEVIRENVTLPSAAIDNGAMRQHTRRPCSTPARRLRMLSVKLLRNTSPKITVTVSTPSRSDRKRTSPFPTGPCIRGSSVETKETDTSKTFGSTPRQSSGRGPVQKTRDNAHPRKKRLLVASASRQFFSQTFSSSSGMSDGPSSVESAESDRSSPRNVPTGTHTSFDRESFGMAASGPTEHRRYRGQLTRVDEPARTSLETASMTSPAPRAPASLADSTALGASSKGRRKCWALATTHRRPSSLCQWERTMIRPTATANQESMQQRQQVDQFERHHLGNECTANKPGIVSEAAPLEEGSMVTDHKELWKTLQGALAKHAETSAQNQKLKEALYAERRANAERVVALEEDRAALEQLLREFECYGQTDPANYGNVHLGIVQPPPRR